MEPKQYADRVKQALTDIQFPTTKQEIINKKGNTTVEVAEGKTVTIRDALQPVQKDRFESSNELLNQVNQAHNLNWPRM
ncbi:MAG TPA: hypothetical protein VM889_02870 [Candidatus Thermoplasmatota archaeon]|nr:hypothetical protein [Candidatus Thermoplasmatota archaeon]